MDAQEDDHIGAQIKLHRKRLGMTMLELASKTGLSQGAISMIENGLRQATPQTLEKLSEVLQFALPEQDQASHVQTSAPQVISVETLGFTFELEVKSFASDLKDEAVNHAVYHAFTAQLQQLLRQGDVLGAITHALQTALKEEAEKKEQEVKRLYDKIDRKT